MWSHFLLPFLTAEAPERIPIRSFAPVPIACKTEFDLNFCVDPRYSEIEKAAVDTAKAILMIISVSMQPPIYGMFAMIV